MHPIRDVSNLVSSTVLRPGLLAMLLAGAALGSAHAQPSGAIPLSDQPVFASSQVPGNLALALSVEYPTVSRIAHVGDYSSSKEFLGYFDPNKCYVYRYDSTAVISPGGSFIEKGKGDSSYFDPVRITNNRKCLGNNEWSGNFLNWASLTAIEPFRWALTGGRRVVDKVGETIVEKGWNAGQGYFPERNQNYNSDGVMPASEISGATPFKDWKILRIQVNGRGYAIRIIRSERWWGDNERTEDYTIRVKVCNPEVGVESNCVQYGENNWKPEGLIQQYANQMRFSAFGYLNQTGNDRDGGVLRARQKFVGPSYPRPGQAAASNPSAEWNPSNGTMIRNPDSADAVNTSVWARLNGSESIQDSGVMNYVNKFGQIILGDYKGNDPVNELYYAVLRYFRGLENMDIWTNLGNADKNRRRKYLDGFPVIRDWTKEDPIQYACQRNFVLGIGDIYTHADKNVPGGIGDTGLTNLPNFNDPVFNAIASTNNAKRLQGLGNNTANAATGSSGSTDYMAGLAFEANTKDIRPDDINRRQTIGKQTVQTYWMDVLEAPFSPNNKYYLAAKFGGLKQDKLPPNFDPYKYDGDIPDDWWTTNGDVLSGGGKQWPRPDNYFTAGNPASMVSGLQEAFKSIASQIRAYTTSFSYTSADVVSGDLAYSSQYDSNGWTGAVSARVVTYSADGSASGSERWSTDTTLSAQLADEGWNSARRVIAWDANKKDAVPFRYSAISQTMRQALDTTYVDGNDAQRYLNYVRGSKTDESTSNAPDSTHSYRPRTAPLGDIVNSKVTAVGAPVTTLMDAFNPGYTAFRQARSTRKTVVYVGSNDGMLHAFDGSGTGTTAGQELFAYIPGDMFNLTYAQSSTTGQPGPDTIIGNLGNPNYAHRYAVDATPLAFDLDFNNTAGATSDAPDWRTVLIGGLGKGGTSYYAIDITDPDAFGTEDSAAGKVLWEFRDEHLGFSFGAPTVVKTAKYGWVVILPSGYNNADGYGYLFIVNPRTGTLLEKIKTPSAAPGLAHASAFVADFGNGMTDAVYAGDLNGKLWRFDLTAPQDGPTYPAPTHLATLTGSNGATLPITTAPLIEIHPDTRARYVLIGTGKLLDVIDINNSQEQAFYAIKDGSTTQFGLPGRTAPITRNDLTEVENLTTGITIDMASLGWYSDLGTSSGIGWRVVANPIAASNVIAFTTMLTTGDACSPAGVSRVYALDFGFGKTVLESGDPYAEFDTSITDLRLLDVDGNVELIAGDNQGNIQSVETNIGTSSALRLLNWRETFTFD